jgi:aminomethyltransferase
MGRLRLDGSGAAAFLDRLLTRKIIGHGPGKIRYSLVCNESGGILDDVLVYHLQAAVAGLYHLVGRATPAIARRSSACCGRTCRPRTAMCDCRPDDGTAMIAVQGPPHLRSCRVRSSGPISADWLLHRHWKRQSAARRNRQPHGLHRRRRLRADRACGGSCEVWEKVLAHGKATGAVAAGLGARDTLRLEAAMPLYGHELTNDQINPRGG